MTNVLTESRVPAIRLRDVNDAPIRPAGRYVLYWMTAARRTGWSFALERAAEWAATLGRPLVILEALRTGYPHASDRLHAFVLQGMAENARRLAGRAVTFHPYVEPAPGAGRGLLAALAEEACLVVADEHPGFFLPRMVEAAGRALARVGAERRGTSQRGSGLPEGVRLEAVDGCGLLPIRAPGKAFSRAVDFRRFVQKSLLSGLPALPLPDPLVGRTLPRLGALPTSLLERWPAAAPSLLAGSPTALAALPIDHDVAPVDAEGGSTAAEAALARFLDRRLGRYAEERHHPDEGVESGLSPWLHFGHLSAVEVFAAVTEREGWDPGRLGAAARGAKEGFWGLTVDAEAFLDQLLTWRELGLNTALYVPGYDRYESLPPWARETLGRHAADPRPHRYHRDALEEARTHDAIWNAAQRELRSEGRLQGYLRMLWGKKILEWSASPEEAFETMLALNDRFALDGRDPNSVAGVAWVLGRYDRPWAPERPIFGRVRFMSSPAARRKLRMEEYLERYGREG